jgi:hypothetical protein
MTTRPNKLEHLSLETLSSQVLEFEGRPEATQVEHISDASFLGKLLVLPANDRQDWKVIEKKFLNINSRGLYYKTFYSRNL